MKIGFCCDMFIPTSGVDRVCYELAKRFQKKHDVTVYSRKGYINMEWVKEAHLNIKEIPSSFAPRRYSYVINGVRIIKNERLDIVNTHGGLLGISSVLANIPTVTTYHGHLPFSQIPIHKIPARILSQLEWSFCFKGSKKIVAICKFAREKLGKFAKKSEIIYNGVDTKFFSPRGKTVDLGDRSILYVGSPHKHKRLPLLFETVKKLAGEIPDIKLYTIGKDHEQFSNLTKNLPIKFLGKVPDVELPNYYRGCSVFASASCWEIFTLPFLEAQSCEKPVVGFNLAGIPESVVHGKTGFLANDKREFLYYIKLLLEDDCLRRKMGRNGRKWVKKFDWDNVVKKYGVLFERVIANGTK
jgi:glycosyltransferase involved in cell wall biosynthesis